uniref:Uncharacterized protein n=1 Tax=Glossina palpalis gambiensis TaxID=67801 RepID=A0A1B0B741_9MUSC
MAKLSTEWIPGLPQLKQLKAEERENGGEELLNFKSSSPVHLQLNYRNRRDKAANNFRLLNQLFNIRSLYQVRSALRMNCGGLWLLNRLRLYSGCASATATILPHLWSIKMLQMSYKSLNLQGTPDSTSIETLASLIADYAEKSTSESCSFRVPSIKKWFGY